MRKQTVASNGTSLYSTIQSDPDTLPVAAAWLEREPNSYDSFGAKQETESRDPINAGRMRKKGETVGEEPGCGFQEDLTAENISESIKGFMFANYRTKSEVVSTTVVADGYTISGGGAAYVSGDIIFAKYASKAVNNGMKILTVDGTANKILVSGLSADVGDAVTISRVGHEFEAGELSVDITGPLPALESSDFDLTTLGLIPGEIIFIGGDAMANQFAKAQNRGWARVYSVTDSLITLDKTDAAFDVDVGTGKTVRIFFGRVIKNESDPALQETFYTAFRRQLGKSDTAGTVESEVVSGNVCSKMTFNIPEKKKLTVDFEYMGRDYKRFNDDDTVDAGGSFVPVVEQGAFNSSKDTRRLRVAAYDYDAPSSAPIPLFSAFNDFKLVIDNNISANNAISRFGTFAHTPGMFDFTGSGTAYFSGIRAIDLIKNNEDLTLMMTAYKQGKGIAWDAPMISIDTDGLDIKQNEPIMLDIDTQAATGKKYSLDMNHALLMVFYDYLPAIAAA